jgi:glycerophosphoryl diester phosphodiesterase
MHSSKLDEKTGRAILPAEWPRYVAHRGASTLAPENSLAAFAKARSLGARAVELDVHLCATGELVVAHDQWLDRIAGIHARIEETAWDDLRAIDTGSFFNKKFPESANTDFAKERIPTLDEVFEILGPDICVDVEMKSGSFFCEPLARATAECIARNGRKNCIVSSFNPAALRYYRKFGAEPTAAIYCGEKEAPWYMRHRECLYLSGADIKKPDWKTASGARRYETGKKPVMVWTVDSRDEAAELLENGVTSVITNRIQDFL